VSRRAVQPVAEIPQEVRLDETDWRILRTLQENGRATNRSLALDVDLSPPGLQKRLRRLEEKGVIQRYVALLDREVVGLDILCFVQVTLATHEPETRALFRAEIRNLPEVLECHHLTGEYDYLLKVVTSNHKHLERFLFDDLTPAPGVDRTRTSIVLREIKHSTSLPLDRVAP